jgi:hypothetical protein
MQKSNKSVMVGLAALVAVAAVIVYAYRVAVPMKASSAVITSQAESTAPPKTPAAPPETVAPEPLPPAVPTPLSGVTSPPSASPPSGPASKVLYDLNQLPPPVQHMLKEIVVAAQSGDIERMRPVLESNELKPMVAAAAVDDPIAFWKKASADGEGRDVLAALLNILSSGFVRMKEGREEMYVWPYFAETNLATLTPQQQVELYRVVPAAQAKPMQQSGKYSYYRVGIAADGVWHYFLP